MGNGVQRLHQGANAALRKHERIAAGQDHFPNLGRPADVAERGLDFGLAEISTRIGADHLAPEAEAAVDRADPDDLEKHTVRVAVYEPRNGALQSVADRVGLFGGEAGQFRHIGQKLPGYRVVRCRSVDQRRHRRGYRDGIARRHVVDCGFGPGRCEAGGDEIVSRSQGPVADTHLRGQVSVSWSGC